VLRCLHLISRHRKLPEPARGPPVSIGKPLSGGRMTSLILTGLTLRQEQVLTNNPTLMSIYRMGKARSHEQVAPVPLGEIHRATEVFHVSLTQLERSKT
jgi:hypothetical protein